MNGDKQAALWRGYRSRPVSTAVHPDDHMFRTNPTLDDYDKVGESAARVVHSVLGLTPKEAIWRVLDFGCGHGRVARHLRAMFPEAEMWFADSDPSCIDFCAATFAGTPVLSYAELDRSDLPRALDLIWVGSVFTHIDLARMRTLFDHLWASVGRGGVFIATFHGHRKFEVMTNTPAQAERYQPLLRSYQERGHGYQSYEQPDLGDWGSSLTSIETVVGLGARHRDARLVTYSEAGWAGIQDVAAWWKI